MRVVYSIFLLLASLVATDLKFLDQGLKHLDRFYSFAQVQDNDLDNGSSDAKTNLGLLMEKSFYHEPSQLEFNTALQARLLDLKNSEFDLREGYAVYSLNDTWSLRAGRELFSFSNATLLSLANFMRRADNANRLQDNDRALNDLGVDGFSLSYYQDFMAAFYIYNVNEKLDSKKLHSVLQLQQESDSYIANAYLVNAGDDVLETAFHINANVSDEINAILESSLKDKQLSYTIGSTYTPHPAFAVSLEKSFRSFGHDKAEGSAYRNKALQDFFTSKELDTLDMATFASLAGQRKGTHLNKYFNRLNSKNYLGLMLGFRYEDYMFRNIVLNNSDDGSNQAMLEVEYPYGQFRFYSRYMRHFGDKNSEFGSSDRPKQRLQFLVAFSH